MEHFPQRQAERPQERTEVPVLSPRRALLLSGLVAGGVHLLSGVETEASAPDTSHHTGTEEYAPHSSQERAQLQEARRKFALAAQLLAHGLREASQEAPPSLEEEAAWDIRAVDLQPEDILDSSISVTAFDGGLLQSFTTAEEREWATEKLETLADGLVVNPLDDNAVIVTVPMLEGGSYDCIFSVAQKDGQWQLFQDGNYLEASGLIDGGSGVPSSIFMQDSLGNPEEMLREGISRMVFASLATNIREERPESL